MRKIIFFVCSLFVIGGAAKVQSQSVGLLRLAELEEYVKGSSDETVVVNFWATWCAPCVKELPYFQQLHEKYSSSSVKVMLVSLDGKPALENKVRPFVGRSGMTADFFLLDETNQQEYIDRIDPSWSGALPATLIVNPGTEKRVFIEGEVTLSQLEEALREVK